MDSKGDQTFSTGGDGGSCSSVRMSAKFSPWYQQKKSNVRGQKLLDLGLNSENLSSPFYCVNMC